MSSGGSVTPHWRPLQGERGVGECTCQESEPEDRQAQKKERGPERPTAVLVGQKCPLTTGRREGEIMVRIHFPSVKLASKPLNETSLPSTPGNPQLRMPNSNLIIKNPACSKATGISRVSFPACNFSPAAVVR